MTTMQCPKCAGEAYLAEEELVQVLENTDPLKAIIKAHFTCKACAGTFIRLVTEALDAKKKECLPRGSAYAASSTPAGVSSYEAAEGLRFF
jgi:transposase-like protein